MLHSSRCWGRSLPPQSYTVHRRRLITKVISLGSMLHCSTRIDAVIYVVTGALAFECSCTALQVRSSIVHDSATRKKSTKTQEIFEQIEKRSKSRSDGES